MQPPSRKRPQGELKAEFERALEPGRDEKGRLDLERLRRSNVPLAEVLDEFMEAKTDRDDIGATAKDLARSVAARDPSSDLGKALSALEEEMADSLEQS